MQKFPKESWWPKITYPYNCNQHPLEMCQQISQICFYQQFLTTRRSVVHTLTLDQPPSRQQQSNTKTPHSQGRHHTQRLEDQKQRAAIARPEAHHDALIITSNWPLVAVRGATICMLMPAWKPPPLQFLILGAIGRSLGAKNGTLVFWSMFSEKEGT